MSRTSGWRKGVSGNPNGRPSAETLALKNLDKGELDKLLSVLRRSAPKALKIILDAMEDESTDMDKRVKRAETVLQYYLKTYGMHMMSEKKVQQAQDEDGEMESTERPIIYQVDFSGGLVKDYEKPKNNP